MSLVNAFSIPTQDIQCALYSPLMSETIALIPSCLENWKFEAAS